ncbi:MAG TPA: 30S ribosome-binding factor RbfA [Bacteroidota bacterium]|nr:30S ribosome-binding factor RbfA [Bacteroidota bacterium]
MRVEKVASLLHRELGSIISRECSDNGCGFTTVTEVRMTPDLKLAKVYVSIFGNQALREKTLKHLEAQKKEIRMQMASRVSMRFVPALQFYHDATLDQVQHLEELIKEIHKNDPPAHHDEASGSGETE